MLLAKPILSSLVPKCDQTTAKKIQGVNMQLTQLMHCLDWQKALWAT